MAWGLAVYYKVKCGITAQSINKLLIKFMAKVSEDR